MTIDFRQTKQVISDEKLGKVSELSQKQVDLEREVEELEQKLANKKDELKRVQEFELPEAMSECGVSEFKHKDGWKVTVKPYYSAKITDVDAAHTWLREEGFEELIKHEIAIKLGMGDDDLSTEVKEFVKALGLSYVDKEGVHHSTLAAFVREQIEGGNTNFPLQLFNVFVGRKAKVSIK